MAIQKQQQLFIVGLGIKSLSHLTEESKHVIAQADHVLYLLNEPLLKEYVAQNARSSVDLETIYFAHDERLVAYQHITKVILQSLQQHERVAVVCYGHPFYCAGPFLDAAQAAKRQQIEVVSMPGISSLDCLFSDLMIDPVTDGLSVIEASTLLETQRRIDPLNHVVLLQVGFVGVRSHTHLSNNEGFQELCTYLEKDYPLDHPVTLYEASLYPSVEPVIQTIPLKDLQSHSPSAICSLYLPPLVAA